MVTTAAAVAIGYFDAVMMTSARLKSGDYERINIRCNRPPYIILKQLSKSSEGEPSGSVKMKPDETVSAQSVPVAEPETQVKPESSVKPGSYTMDQLKLLITQSSAADPLLQLWQKSLSSSVASFISSSVYALLCVSFGRGVPHTGHLAVL